MRRIFMWVAGMTYVLLLGLAAYPAHAIVGGTEAREAGSNVFLGGCGGTLISSRWVASAWHCFHDDRTGSVTTSGTVQWGSTNKRDGNAVPWSGVEHVGDLALLRLETEVPAEAGPFPRLADEDPPVGTMVTLFGFGDVGEGQPSPVLRTATAPVHSIGLREDAEHGPSWRSQKTGTGDPFYGDSGSGAFLNGKLVGVVSSGNQEIGNFVSIAAHRSFIEQTIRG